MANAVSGQVEDLIVVLFTAGDDDLVRRGPSLPSGLLRIEDRYRYCARVPPLLLVALTVSP